MATLLHALVHALRRPISRCRARPCRAWSGPSANPGRRLTWRWWTPLRWGILCNSSGSVSRPEDDERKAAELPDINPVPQDPAVHSPQSTFRVVCDLDLAVLADAHIRRLHVGAFGREHAWRHLKPLMGAAVPHPPPMQAAARGSKVEVSAGLTSAVLPLVMRASGKAQDVYFRPWIVTGAACQHPAFVLYHWSAAGPPPRFRRPSPRTRSSN